MAASRFYSSTAGRMVLASGVSAGAATIVVDTVTGLPPSLPFTLMIDPGTATEEVVEATVVGGFTLTITRGVDGTTAQAHLIGAEVRHAYSARDFQDSRNHEASVGAHGLTAHQNATNAHGATGAVVGTTNVQVLTGKTMSGASNNFNNIPTTAMVPAGGVPYAQAAGQILLSAAGHAAGSTNSTLAVFPVGRFTRPPLVTVSVSDDTAGGNIMTAHVFSITAAQTQVVLVNLGTATVTYSNLPVTWHAVQMTSASAAG